MKNLGVVFLFIVVSSCVKSTLIKEDAFDFIPNNTAFILNIKNPEILNADFGTSNIVNFSAQSKISNAFGASLKFLKTLKTQNDITVAFSQDSLSYSIITPYNDSIIPTDTTQVKTIEQTPFKKFKIDKKIIADDTLFMSLVDSFFISSNSITQLENTLTSTTGHFDYLKRFKSDAPIAMHFVKDTTINNKEAPLRLLTGNVSLDMDISGDYFSLNGVQKTSDSSMSIFSNFAKTRPVENKSPHIVPNKSKHFISFTAERFDNIISNPTEPDSLNDVSDLNTLKDLVNEIGVFELEKQRVYSLRSIDIDALKESVFGRLEKTFRQVEIHRLDNIKILNSLFNPLITISKTNYCFILDDFMVFTESLESAQEVISSYTNKTTLIHTDLYKNLQDRISDEASILYFANASELDTVLSNNLPYHIKAGLLNKTFDDKHAQVLQIINDNGFAHANLVIQKVTNRARTNSITEVFNTVLDAPIIEAPQLVKNHVNGQMDILVQDIENTLYLISNSGKILWKKKVNSPILGRIEQIDSYKNGRLQLVFATQNALYVLDRNGNNVGSFPMAFNNDITQPVSVFDYDKTRNYRFLVVQGKKTLMLDSKGKRVSGFTFKSADQIISTQPKHFRVGNKDYIVFAAGNTMQILNRRGETRITPKSSINFSENAIYLYKNNFTTTNTKGQLVQIDQRGRVSYQDLLLSDSHQLSATSKTLVSLDENKLTIRSKSIELDFGEYTPPKIFYLNDKIFISVTDLQTQKTFLFDSQAKPIANFPIYGNSSLALDNIDRDKNLEFVVKGDSDRIILYKLN